MLRIDPQRCNRCGERRLVTIAGVKDDSTKEASCQGGFNSLDLAEPRCEPQHRQDVLAFKVLIVGENLFRASCLN
jgi:hypothetical protein